MKYDPQCHHRRSIRLKGYDYAQAGAYFVTICTRERACLFGEVVDGEMRLNDAGRMVERCWLDIPRHFPHVELDAFVIMPNHIHGIIVITSDPDVGARHVEARHVGARHAVPLQMAPHAEQFGKPVPGSLPTIVRSFKSAATKRINIWRGTPGASVWQRNYYEHILRDEASWERVREYIANNPLQWAVDRENPHRIDVHSVGARHAVPHPQHPPKRRKP